MKIMKTMRILSHTFRHVLLVLCFSGTASLATIAPEETQATTNTTTTTTTPPRTLTPQIPQEKEASWSEICKQAKDAVVQIFAYCSEYNLFEPFKTPAQFAGAGTGFFINKYGEILTAYHVVAQSVALYIQIPSLGKERFQVEFVGGSPRKDVAKLRLTENALSSIKTKLRAQEINFLEFGDSDKLTEAQEMMALGFPLGEENLKIALGNVSGRESTYVGECIQTTAPVNPGNSGGPFLNKQGKVVGICVAKQASQEVEGIAYLVPINNVATIMDQFHNGAVIENPYWGIKDIPMTTNTLDFLGGPSDGGVYVKEVTRGALAEEFGIQKGDVLYKINDKQIDKYGYIDSPWNTEKIHFHDYIARLKLASPVTWTIYRAGEKIELSGQIKNTNQYKIKRIYPWFENLLDYEIIGGMVVVELTLNHINVFNEAACGLPLIKKYESDKHRLKPRLMITTVYPSSPFHDTRCFRDGDCIIKKVNGIKVYTVDDFRQAVLTANSTSLTVETTGGSFAAVNIHDIIYKEDELSQKYFFPKSELVAQLAEVTKS